MILRAALPLLAAAASARAQDAPAPGAINIVGNTLISAMMMFLGNTEKVYILDKAEGNPTHIDGHPAWGAVWDIASNTAIPMEVVSNTFCASGMHLPNGSYAAFGGNNPVSPGPVDYHGPGLDPTYQDADGRTAIRILNPCTGDSNSFADSCEWFDDPSVLAMQRARWYSTAESLANGNILIIGGMVDGGYINRPNDHPTDPVTQQGLAENTFEFYPQPPNFTPPVMNLLVEAGGLNTYALAYLLKSGNMFINANISSILFDLTTFEETPLPDMPNDVIRVYPASGANAMLPLTPANNWNPTLLFCGGTNAFTNHQWGGYGGPNCNSWEFGASTDCQRITPEPEDGSSPAFIADDPLPVPRTMGQFIALPDGTLLIINGATNGTAGYTTQTPDIPDQADLPYGTSLAYGPVMTAAIYNPDAPAGSRFSSAGLQASTIPRMYHSSAILLPDASVLVAGSNPNPDYDANTFYNTESRAEIFYPLYWNKTRPQPQGGPSGSLTYGGNYFNVSLPNGTYAGSPNDAAASAKCVLVRPGFTTHAMNMGQRFLQLNSTYTVSDNGDITLHVSQHPPNANLITPGPVLFFVVVDGVPSMGQMTLVGSGDFGVQPILAVQDLPPSTQSSAHPAAGSSGDNNGNSATTKTFSVGVLVAAIGGGVAAAAVLAGAIIWCCRRRRAAAKPAVFDSGHAALTSDKSGLGPYHYGDASASGLMPPPAPYASRYGSDANLGALAPPPAPYASRYGSDAQLGTPPAPYASQYGSDAHLPLGQHAYAAPAATPPLPSQQMRSMYPTPPGARAAQSPGADQYADFMPPPPRMHRYESTTSSAGGSPMMDRPRELEFDPYEQARRGPTHF